ncbi:MAG: folate-binding protein [Nitrosomonas sp.]|nr:folate-binding protein [Nitrosomonas sp.]
MNQTWQKYLLDHHAVIENDSVINFGNAAAELEHTQSATVVVDLSQLGVIRFSGEDAQTFLQGQLTCDVNQVNDQLAQVGSYCTPKGRVLTSFHLWKDRDDYLMQLPLELCASIQKRLTMFVMRAKVKLIDESHSLIRIGLAGNGSLALVEALKNDSSIVSVINYSNDRFELITTAEYAPTLWSQLVESAKPVGTSCWDWLAVRSGVPVVLPVTQDQFIPQMLNLDRLGGVSFKKGCYPGQEIVARTHYLGKIKRRMYLANILATTVAVGDELFSADMAEQSCGKIVNAAPSPNGGVDVLAVIQVSSAEAQDVFWKQLDGSKLVIIQQPDTLTPIES